MRSADFAVQFHEHATHTDTHWFHFVQWENRSNFTVLSIVLSEKNDFNG